MGIKSLTQIRQRATRIQFPCLKTWLPELAALAVIGVVSLAATFPLILHLTTLIPGWPGDNLYFFWELWWFKRALLDLHISPFVDYELYYPVGLELARDEMTPANTVLGLPLTVLFGPAVSYNLLILGSFLLSGYAVYRLIFEATDSRWAALVGGLTFAIAPYRMAHMLGHLNLMATQWLVLSLLFLERMFRSRRPFDGAIAGIWFGLNALAAWYYLYIGAVAVTIFAGVRIWPWRQALRDRRLWYGAILFALLASLLIIPFALPYLQLRESGELQRSFAELDAWSANLTDFLQPNPLHPIWGKVVRQMFPFQWKTYVERTLSVGWVPLILAAVGTWVWRRNRTVQALAFLTVISLVIALGPTLHWDSKRVEYRLPSRAVQFAEQAGVTAALGAWFDPSLGVSVRAGQGFVPLPAILMYALIPVTSSMRVILRFGFVAFLATAILAGYGLAVLLQALRERKWARGVAAIAVGGLVLFELWSVLPDERPQWTQIQARPVDEWLAAQPSQAVIVEFPILQNVDSKAMLYQTFNHQRMVFGGMAPAFRMPLRRGEQLKTFPSAETLSVLRGWGTRYVLVTPALFQNAAEWQRFQEGLAALPDLQLVNEVGGVLVYEIK